MLQEYHCGQKLRAGKGKQKLSLNRILVFGRDNTERLLNCSEAFFLNNVPLLHFLLEGLLPPNAAKPLCALNSADGSLGLDLMTFLQSLCKKRFQKITLPSI